MNEKRLILVIEDEHAISNFICRALAANDYKAIPASSGKEGLSLFFSHSPGPGPAGPGTARYGRAGGAGTAQRPAPRGPCHHHLRP